jgi:hypothetical protein
MPVSPEVRHSWCKCNCSLRCEMTAEGKRGKRREGTGMYIKQGKRITRNTYVKEGFFYPGDRTSESNREIALTRRSDKKLNMELEDDCGETGLKWRERARSLVGECGPYQGTITLSRFDFTKNPCFFFFFFFIPRPIYLGSYCATSSSGEIGNLGTLFPSLSERVCAH